MAVPVPVPLGDIEPVPVPLTEGVGEFEAEAPNVKVVVGLAVKDAVFEVVIEFDGV